MLQSINWQDYLETIIFLLVLFYAIVLAVFYGHEIKLLAQGKLFKKINTSVKDNEDAKTITMPSTKELE
jgi:hypothetical protein